MQSNKRPIKNTKTTKIIVAMIKFLFFLIIVVGIPIYIYIYHIDTLENLRNIDDVAKMLENYETQSVIVYIALQILQIIVCVLPGQFVQMAAGYLFGFILAFIYSVIGTFIGSTVSYYLAYYLGRDAIHLFINENRVTYYVNLLNSKKAYILTFIIFLIPGLPKDIMGYVAGVSDMKYKPFILISLIGRIPSMSGSILIGAFYFTKNYVGMIIVAAVVVIFLIACIIKRKSIKNYMDSFYDRISE